MVRPARPVDRGSAGAARRDGVLPQVRVRSGLDPAGGASRARGGRGDRRAWGEGRLRGGLRRYGAALIGAGGGLIYLGLWAAAGPYALIDRRTGVLLLAGSTVMVSWLALRHEVEGLALWALVGAYLAPMLLRPLVPDPRAFLGYLEVVGLATGLLAYVMVWRRTYDIALGGYLLLAAAGAAPALDTPLGCWFLAAAAIPTLHVTR